MQQARAVRLFAFAVVAAVSAMLIAWSQMHAYVGDESFHLLAAKLIASGKNPYIDFFYQHPPLFAYVMAGVFRLFGISWRSVHLLSALCTIGSLLFAMALSWRLHQNERERWLTAAIVALLLGANAYVVVYATNGLPFAFCILCVTAALYSIATRSALGLFLSGLFIASGAASSLLVSPIVLVFLVWAWIREHRRVGWTLLGILVGALPLLVLLSMAPAQVIDNVIKYHLVNRPQLGWRFNVREIATWLFSIQSIILVGFALVGFRVNRNPELRLCAWTSVVLAVVLALIKTTTGFYFVVLTPFLVILASAGITMLGNNLVVLTAAAIYLIGLTGVSTIWKREAPYEDYREVASVTRAVKSCAPSGNFYADEATYFEAATLPPPHMENRFDPNSAGDAGLAAGSFDAVAIGARNPKVERYDLNAKYGRRTLITLKDYKLLLFCDRISSPR